MKFVWYLHNSAGAFCVQQQYSSDIFFLSFVCFLALSVYSWICEQPLFCLSISSISGQSSKHVGQGAKEDLYLLLVLSYLRPCGPSGAKNKIVIPMSFVMYMLQLIFYFR